MMWIRKRYAVPAKRGGRIVYTGEGDDKPEYGTISSARGGQLWVRLDGQKLAMPYHPTWKLSYL